MHLLELPLTGSSSTSAGRPFVNSATQDELTTLVEWQRTDKEALQIDAVDVASVGALAGIDERRR